jgi:hypothetical protein
MNKPDENPQRGRSEADLRRERLAAQLRDNLKKRKAQSKARRAHGEGTAPSNNPYPGGETE